MRWENEYGRLNIYPLVIEQFAIENGPFIVDLPIEDI